MWVILCSIGAALLGLIVSAVWLLVLAGNFRIAFVGPLLAINLYDVAWAIHGGSYSILVAGTSLMASIQYWRCKRRGIYLHILAILTLLPTLSLAA